MKQTSVVSCEDLLTVVQSDILRTIGHLPDRLMRRVDAALKVSLALPEFPRTAESLRVDRNRQGN